MWTYNYSDELYHHGVKGMKWGVRRYQNYDGSLTKEGVKRFNESLDKYEKADIRYKTAKKNKTSKTEIDNSRLARKNAKRQLTKDYKHLKQDKLADKGKTLYSKGSTITSNATITNMLGTVGTISASAAAYMYKQKGLDMTTKILAGTALGTMSVAAIKKIYDYDHDKKLRAYYSHTSNY